mmetsp:Transcript_18655/g.43280  ORF Transcript_18655/g.43280 Transcript_18655/m.43280 type:complete len:220 (-) Transcript_18655:596-1255(-)
MNNLINSSAISSSDIFNVSLSSQGSPTTSVQVSGMISEQQQYSHKFFVVSANPLFRKTRHPGHREQRGRQLGCLFVLLVGTWSQVGMSGMEKICRLLFVGFRDCDSDRCGTVCLSSLLPALEILTRHQLSHQKMSEIRNSRTAALPLPAPTASSACRFPGSCWVVVCWKTMTQELCPSEGSQRQPNNPSRRNRTRRKDTSNKTNSIPEIYFPEIHRVII